MQTRPLGRTGITVGEIGLGTWSLAGEAYGPVTDDEVRMSVLASLSAGVTFFDTADCYRNGRIETLLGEMIARHGRKGITVCTRIGVERSGPHPRKRFDGPYLRRACEASLKRLGGDCIDVLVLHNPQVGTLTGPDAWPAMLALQREGKARVIGVSVSSEEQGRAALDVGAELLVLPYNLMFSRVLHALSGEISQRGTAVVARSPLAYGLLADTWGGGRRFGDEDHRSWRWGPNELAVRLKQREAFRPLVRGNVLTLREAALRYVLSNGLVSVVVPGARTPQMARANAHAASTLPYLPDEDLARMGDLLADAGIRA